MNASPGLLHAAHAELERTEQARDNAEGERRAGAEQLAVAARELTAAKAGAAQLFEPVGTAPPAPKPAPRPPPPRRGREPSAPATRCAGPETGGVRRSRGQRRAEVAWQPRGPLPERKTAWARPLVFGGVAAAGLLVGVVWLLPPAIRPAAPPCARGRRTRASRRPRRRPAQRAPAIVAPAVAPSAGARTPGGAQRRR